MRLIYFTSAYPYNLGEQWKTNELKELVHYFDDITIIPYSSSETTTNVDVPEGIKVLPPLFKKWGEPLKKADILKIFLHKHRSRFLAEFFDKKVYANKNHFISWATVSLKIIRLLDHPIIKNVVSEMNENTVWYFYWGIGSCEIMPFVDSGKLKKSIVRVHNFDLYEERHHGYIPYRKPLLKSISYMVPIAENGKQYIAERYPFSVSKLKLMRLGSINATGAISKPSTDGVLRVVSCSLMAPVKRIHLMLEAVKHLDISVEWTHVGDGPLEDELRELHRQYNLGDKFTFQGFIKSDKIIEFYAQHSFDIFVNVSSAEGVPVSIMESFSVGIPVLATDVGGTSEIVDDAVGGLLDKDITGEALAVELTKYNSLSVEEKEQKRSNAVAKHREMCNAVQLAKEMGEFLVSDS